MSTETIGDLDLEQEELEEQISTLQKLETRTAEQETELKELKKKLGSNATLRIKHKHSELLAERNKRTQVEQELAALKLEAQKKEQS